MPYLSALEVCSRRGAIQIHVYLYLLTPLSFDFGGVVVGGLSLSLSGFIGLSVVTSLLNLSQYSSTIAKNFYVDIDAIILATMHTFTACLITYRGGYT